MVQQFIETLENRQFLSVSLPGDAEPLPTPALYSTAVPKAATQPTLIANSFFQGTVKLDGVDASIVLKVTSVAAGKVSAVLYSNDWGGFNVPVTGTFSASRVLTLTGKNANCQFKTFTGTLSADAKLVSGRFSIVQMGIAASGNIQINRVAKAPTLRTPGRMNLLNTYHVKSSDGDSLDLTFTKQEGGLLWGRTTHDDVLTGIQYASGKIHLCGRKTGGSSDIKIQVAASGSITGTWAWRGTGGDRENGTLSGKKV